MGLYGGKNGTATQINLQIHTANNGLSICNLHIFDGFSPNHKLGINLNDWRAYRQHHYLCVLEAAALKTDLRCRWQRFEDLSFSGPTSEQPSCFCF